MIHTPDQRALTVRRAAEFRAALAASPHAMDPLGAARREAMESVAAELEGEAAEYDDLAAGRRGSWAGRGPAALSSAVAAARVGLGIGRDRMASLLGVPEAEYARWEDGGFQDAPFHRLMEASAILGVEVAVSVDLSRRA